MDSAPRYLTIEATDGNLTPDKLEEMLSIFEQSLPKDLPADRKQRVLAEARTTFSQAMGEGGLARISLTGAVRDLRRLEQTLDIHGRNLTTLADALARGAVSLGKDIDTDHAGMIAAHITGMLGVASSAISIAADLLSKHLLGEKDGCDCDSAEAKA